MLETVQIIIGKAVGTVACPGHDDTARTIRVAVAVAVCNAVIYPRGKNEIVGETLLLQLMKNGEIQRLVRAEHLTTQDLDIIVQHVAQGAALPGIGGIVLMDELLENCLLALVPDDGLGTEQRMERLPDQSCTGNGNPNRGKALAHGFEHRDNVGFSQCLFHQPFANGSRQRLMRHGLAFCIVKAGIVVCIRWGGHALSSMAQ